MISNKKIGIIVVAYHNATMTERFIKTELAKLSTQFYLVVVNNASTHEESLRLAKSCDLEFINNDLHDNIPNSTKYLIWSQENLGYARGNNKGVAFLNRIGGFTHFLFSNDDITINNTNILNRLVEKMDTNKEIGAIGPRIINLDGIDQNPKDHYISLYREIGWILLAPFRKSKKQRAITAKDEAEESRMTYWTSGDFLLVKANAFNKVGGFDPHTFLYYEECILAERLAKIDLHFYYDASITIIHFEGSSTTKNRNNQLIGIQSKLYYYKKYKHTNALIIFLYKVIEYINYKLKQ